MTRSLFKPVLIVAATVTLSACVSYDDPYINGASYGGGEYYEPYSDGNYDDPYYGGSYYGWYDDYYYPGVGFYIYDRRGDRFRWNDRNRHYWEGRRGRHNGQANWGGYSRGQDGYYRDQRRGEHRRGQYRDDRQRGDRDGDGRRDRRRGNDEGNRRGFGLNPDPAVRNGTPETRGRDGPRRDRRGSAIAPPVRQDRAVTRPPQPATARRQAPPVAAQPAPTRTVRQAPQAQPAPPPKAAPAARRDPPADVERRPRRSSPRNTTNARKHDD